jgi:Heparinase II/III-like protein
MHSGRYFAGHQHPDQNSFVIHAYGEKLAIDGGYYDWYGSPHFKAYSMTTLAHNTLLVDGQGQAVCKTGSDGRIADYFDSPGYGYTVGDASNPVVYGGLLKRFDRRILFIKPGFVVIHDLLTSSKDEPQLDWLLHAITPITTDPSTAEFSLQCDKAALRGRFLSPAALHLSVKTGFPVEPVNRYSTDPVPKDKYFPEWILYARPKQPAGKTEFLAAMQIQRLGEKNDPAAKIDSLEAENAHCISLSCADSTHVVLFRKAGAEGLLRCGALQTDGAAAAVELDSTGNVLNAFTADATFLRHDDKTLFKSLTRESWAMP